MSLCHCLRTACCADLCSEDFQRVEQGCEVTVCDAGLEATLPGPESGHGVHAVCFDPCESDPEYKSDDDDGGDDQTTTQWRRQQQTDGGDSSDGSSSGVDNEGLVAFIDGEADDEREIPVVRTRAKMRAEPFIENAFLVGGLEREGFSCPRGPPWVS